MMASSVSSERAFSSAGITISKRRNRLKGDIVEALECIKCIYHHGLLFREFPSISQVEQELEAQEMDKDLESFADAVMEAQDFAWDSILDDDEDNIVEIVD